MTDILSRSDRSALMARIRGKDTAPERAVRSLVHGLGYRFRLHVRDLPGRPDLVLPRLATVIFVHGCYWHRHSCPAGRVVPKTRSSFWTRKFECNVARDRLATARLRRLGWRVLSVWECETKQPLKLQRRLRRLLDARATT